MAGVVPLSADRTKVLLIQSTRHGGWVIPKGGWELDEDTAQAAACREAWEEAGILCRVQDDLGLIHETRNTKQAPKALYQFFEVIVEKEEVDWPERHKRARRWMTYVEAANALQARPELLEALNRSTVVR